MNGPSLQDRFADSMGQLLGPEFPSDIALAVSGGGDSMAMLYLAHNWTHVYGVRLWVVTVDHGLRPESADEAAMVARECADLGWPHATLRWQGWDGQGNLMDAARRARLSLIDRWKQGLEHVLFAHTSDDVAETFLMRLARGSGVDGLAAMAPVSFYTPPAGAKNRLSKTEMRATEPPPLPKRRVAGVPGFLNGFHVVRPLLNESRADLRHYLKALHGPYVDDPTNEDDRFDRARMRKVLDVLQAEGVSRENLADTARRLARSRVALAARAREVGKRIVTQSMAAHRPTGDLLIDRDGLAEIERDTQLRLLAHALKWVSSAEYGPRATALEDLLEKVLAGGGATLHGCDVRAGKAHVRVAREWQAVKGLEAETGQIWDGRWMIYGSEIKGMTLRPLGEEGLAQIHPWPEHAPPKWSARSLPAVFDAERLVAVSALGFGPTHMVELRPRHPVLPG